MTSKRFQNQQQKNLQNGLNSESRRRFFNSYRLLIAIVNTNIYDRNS